MEREEEEELHGEKKRQRGGAGWRHKMNTIYTLYVFRHSFETTPK